MSNVINIPRTPTPTDTSLTPFSFGLIDVRVTTRNGEPWFVLADVCRVLEHSNPSKAALALDADEKGLTSCNTPGGTQNLVIVSESGLYRLVMRSDKPQSRRFQKWVTSEVLPAIRKTGKYGQPKDTLTALNDPAALRGLLLTYSEKVIALQGDVAKLEPVAQVAKDIAASECEHMTLSTAAKACQMRMTDFIRWLHDLGWLASKGKTQEHRNQA